MSAEGARFEGSVLEKAEAFPHFWEHTIGSGHATLALRADWQKQLARCRRELGFRHVRFHGLLSDDMGTLVQQKDQLIYSFFNADQICDFLLSIDMQPFVGLSFMPEALASGQKRVFHYGGNVTPPRDYVKWGMLIHKLVGHWVERYGGPEVARWFFEVWNEPNLSAFWNGGQRDYFELYRTAACAIKSVDDMLKVGGPATASNAWIADFLKFAEGERVGPDFLSTHHYPTDAFGKPGDDTTAQLAASHRSVLREQAQEVRKTSGGKPVYYTEWCTSSNPFDPLHDLPYAAAFIVKTVMEARGLVEGYSYWTFSDLFEENYFASTPFHGGFGLLTIHGVPKPAYRAFQLLHRMGEELLPLRGSHATVDAWLSRKGPELRLLVSNSALPRHPIASETVHVELQGVPEIRAASLERIDDGNSNARRLWEEMGSPEYLSPREVEALEGASELAPVPHPVQWSGGTLSADITLPPQGVALLSLEAA